jgi:hypothetical protein
VISLEYDAFNYRPEDGFVKILCTRQRFHNDLVNPQADLNAREQWVDDLFVQGMIASLTEGSFKPVIDLVR